MVCKSRLILGLTRSGAFGEKEVLRNFRNKIKTEPERLLQLSEAAFDLVKKCPMEIIGAKLIDEVFNDMLEGATYSKETETAELLMRGFKPISHKGMFSILKKKFGKNEGARFELNDCEIVLEYLTLPNDRTGLPHKFPPLKIKLSSTINHLKFEIGGESSCLFVLFYLKSILQSFLKQLPEEVEKCYRRIGDIGPKDGTDEERDNSSKMESSNSDSSGSKEHFQGLEKSPSPVYQSKRKPRKPRSMSSSPSPDIVTPSTLKPTTPPSIPTIPTAKLSTPSPTSSASSLPSPDIVSHSTSKPTTPPSIRTIPTVRLSTPSPTSSASSSPSPDIVIPSTLKPTTPPSIPTIPTARLSTPSPTSSASSPPSPPAITGTIDQVKSECVDCALNRITHNVETIVDTIIQIDFTCTLVCLESGETLHNFSSKLCETVSKTNSLDYESLPIFRENMDNIIQTIISKMTDGAAGFYCRMWKYSPSLEGDERDRLAVSTREILEFCLTEEFEKTLMYDKEARRLLIEYLGSTGSYFAFQSVIESFCEMFNKKVNLTKILPENMRYIMEMFKNGPDAEEDLAYHDFIGEISRSLITNVFQTKNIEYFELKRKSYKLDDKQLEIVGDNFVYVDKVCRRLFHFLYLDGSIYAEPIPLDTLIIDQEKNIVSSQKWNFFFEHETVLVKGIMTNEEAAANKHEKETDPQKQEEVTPLDKHENKDKENSFELSGGSDDSSESDNEAARIQVANAVINIQKENIKKYWDTRPNVRRKFLAGMCGADWPQMYGSPCVVVMGYNYVKLPGSQKRSSNFAKMKGSCKICESTHVFEILENPFNEEIGDDNLLTYSAVRDLHIDVTVTGHFHARTEGHTNEPDITRPIHDLKKAAGHHLKGKERELIAKRASKIGVKNTYLEQLDFANKEQIEEGNTTSVRSVPVIKVARRELEKKEQGGQTFYESVLNVFETQHSLQTANFEETTTSKKFPGYIRKVSKIKSKQGWVKFTGIHFLSLFLYYF